MVVIRELTPDTVTRSTGPLPQGAAALDHETGNHAVKDKAIVKTFRGKSNKILYRVLGAAVGSSSTRITSPLSRAIVATGLVTSL